MVLIDKLIQTLIAQGGTDLHLKVGRPPVIRLHGRLRTLNTSTLTPEDTVALMKSISPERAQQELQEVGGSDFGFSFGKDARFRISIYKEKRNVGIAMRLLPTRFFTFEEIGLPSMVKRLCLAPRGIILVTGPTSSGKTTTLATMIDYINTETDRHIITIEDPIEYFHEHKKCIVTQRELGIDVPSFAEALRRGLRQNPDVFMVGEMRDLETIQAAITAAETGHLVFATLHTTGAEGTVNRIIDVFPTEQQEQIRVQLSVTIMAVVSQQLLPRASGQGLIAAFELMICTPAIRNLIRENKTFRIDSMIQIGKKYGMCLLDEHLFALYQKGLISAEDAIFKSRKPDELRQKIQEFDATAFAAGSIEDVLSSDLKE